MVLFVTMVALFFVTSFWIGGDAFQGHVKDGHFFVREHSNSPEHEVSRTTYLLSLWEMRVLFAMWVVGFAGGLLHWLKLEG